MTFFLTLQVCTRFQTNQLDLVKNIKLNCKGMLVKKSCAILSIIVGASHDNRGVLPRWSCKHSTMLKNIAFVLKKHVSVNMSTHYLSTHRQLFVQRAVSQ